MHEELEGERRVALGSRQTLDQRFEQRRQIAGLIFELALCDAVFADGVDVREVCLFVGGAKIAKQVEHLVERFIRPRIASVDLVDDADDREVELDALRQYEARLG